MVENLTTLEARVLTLAIQIDVLQVRVRNYRIALTFVLAVIAALLLSLLYPAIQKLF